MRKLALFMCLLVLAGSCVFAQQMRPAEKIAVGQTTHFTLDKDEQKDFGIQLAKGSYYIVWDIARMDGKTWNMIAHVQLLKSNGSMVDSLFLHVNEVEPAARCGKKFDVKKPFMARLRCSNDEDPVDVWMTILPANKLKSLPYAFLKSEVQPLGIGTTEGKGGTLDDNGYAVHSAKLPAGKYDVSLYFKRLDGEKRSNLSGNLERWDPYGLEIPRWHLDMNEIGLEARQEKRLILLKPTTVYFRVLNTDAPVEYTVGIEKATD